MKNLMFIFAFTLVALPAFSQLSLGVKGGINTTSIAPEQLLIKNLEDAKAFGISVKDADYGVHFGFYTQLRINRFLFQPEVMFSSNKINYTVQDFTKSEVVTSVLSESYNYLDVPVMFGYKMGAFRVMGGPVGHVFINSKSELTDLSGYKQKFNDMTYGYQVGIGLTAGRFSLDGRYEGNFTKAGDHFSFFDHDYKFSTAPTRIMVSLGIKLL